MTPATMLQNAKPLENQPPLDYPVVQQITNNTNLTGLINHGGETSSEFVDSAALLDAQNEAGSKRALQIIQRIRDKLSGVLFIGAF